MSKPNQTNLATHSQMAAIVPNYLSFLYGDLSAIYDTWNKGNAYRALEMAIHFIKALTPPIKEQLTPDITKIGLAMEMVKTLQGLNTFQTLRIQNNARAKIADHYLPNLMDKLTNLFDERQYTEKKKREIPTGHQRGME